MRFEPDRQHLDAARLRRSRFGGRGPYGVHPKVDLGLPGRGGAARCRGVEMTCVTRNNRLTGEDVISCESLYLLYLAAVSISPSTNDSHDRA
jgi:hypothetical protein